MTEPIRTIISRCVLLPIENIDTDQIIPARFLKTTTRAGIGAALFADWRYDREGRARPEFALNQPASHGAHVLVAGANFGCGSSREHAPWALLDYGFRAVVSTSFADIFRTNALKNGLLPVAVDLHAYERLLSQGRHDPGATVRIDLELERITLPDRSEAHFPIDPFARHCLLEGIDELGFLLAAEKAIAAYEEDNAPRPTWTP
ncbi:MAG: 3-isopropylmalate dehydratase small subunit [Gemmatimonadaceae bacterium]